MANIVRHHDLWVTEDGTFGHGDILLFDSIGLMRIGMSLMRMRPVTLMRWRLRLLIVLGVSVRW